MNDIFKVTVPVPSTFLLNGLMPRAYRNLPLFMQVASESLSSRITTRVRLPRFANSCFTSD
jgi:hypothetical protein